MQPVTLTQKRELPPVIEDTDALKNLAGLKDELKRKGISEAELSLRSRIKASSIALYVRNKKLPGITDYNKLAGVLGWKILTATVSKDRTGLFPDTPFLINPKVGEALLHWLNSGNVQDAQKGGEE